MLHLLIVDDEELIREEIKSKVLRLAPPTISQIRLASNALEALEACREFQPNIVISDICMPDTDGLTLIRQCSNTYPDIKFIVLSGYGDYGYVREAFKYGIVDYLLKPVRMAELETQLNHAIQQCVDTKSAQPPDWMNFSVTEVRSLPETEPEPQPKSLIGLVKRYIAERPYGNVTLTEVSNLVSMNYTYFSSWFKEETGCTFTAYMMKLKMEQAKTLLENPTLRVNEVAHQVGYDNIYHFSRAFKNYTGHSPKEYRKQTVSEY